jgi:hypothetical protein
MFRVSTHGFYDFETSYIGDSKSTSRLIIYEIVSISMKGSLDISIVTIVIIHISFLGKKKCWVRDGKNAYIEAEVKGSEDDGKIIVETKDGKVQEYLLHLGIYVFSV